MFVITKYKSHQPPLWAEGASLLAHPDPGNRAPTPVEVVPMEVQPPRQDRKIHVGPRDRRG